MRTLPRLAVAATAVAAAATALVAPGGMASAAPSADTSVTFIVIGSGVGDLSIATLPVAAPLSITSGTASGPLPTVTVIDTRNTSPRGWTASASTTDFTGDILTYGVTIAKDKVTYNSGSPLGKLGGGTVSSTGAQNLATTQPIVNRTGLNLLAETITWIPTLSVELPTANGGLPIDTYSGTVTVSVA